MSFTEQPMYRIALILFICSSLVSSGAKAQVPRGVNDTILLGAVVVGKDTLPMIWLPDFYLKAKLPQYLVHQREEYNRLRYNIYKVYPYAVLAAEVLKDVDISLDRLPDKNARKAYLKTVERELNKRFKGQLQDLSITQGQILVKLIDRQTGKNCYSIIKEMKGGFNAFVWQGVALLFSNNLKREYDPQDRDRDIETIVRELEQGRSYN